MEKTIRPFLLNRNQPINPVFNEFLTYCSNTLQHKVTDSEENFIKRGYRINVQSGIPFSSYDFSNPSSKVSGGYFRQMIFRLKPIIELVYGKKPKYYKFKGLYIDKELTNRYTGIAIKDRIFADLDILLAMVTHETPQIHNLVFTFMTSRFYERLVELRYSKTKKKIILLDIKINNKIKIKVQVYTTGKVVLHLGCTYTPIDYSTNGFIQLISLLGQVYNALKHDIAHLDFDAEPVEKWIFSHMDLNRDSISYDFPKIGFTVSMVMNHVQIYSKKIPDGKQKIRAEKWIEPKTTLAEELFTQRFQKAFEIWD